MRYVSARGMPLLWQGEAIDLDIPVITVEAYCKWYGLHIVSKVRVFTNFKEDDATAHIEEVPFPDIGEGTPFCDHVPNPEVVLKWAKKMCYDVCDLSLEMMIGRWALEYENKYADLIGDLG